MMIQIFQINGWAFQWKVITTKVNQAIRTVAKIAKNFAETGLNN